MAERFYCPDPPVQGRLALGPEESRHLARVRRIGPGEIVEVFDGRGQGYRATVQSIGRHQVDLSLLEVLPEPHIGVDLTLATAVPKGERFDWLVEKATELGVARLVPLLVERSTVEPRDAKLERLRRVIVEASKQCGRYRLMELDEPTTWNDFLDRAESESGDDKQQATRLLAHPGGRPLGAVELAGDRPILVAVGPEGGFTDHEIGLARDRGWSLVGLATTILRIETAGLAACAALVSRCQES